ncbi:mycofactocin system glycosyltransferase [Cnuibacter physcomitrellae]|uniref:Mycofactocin system glycosyltransferase n=1 Tax=Cnuibacter physcomitrellae TaxID=1619308 RepID=A0A1X9LKN6_9MICO|nr:mycofactocin biosynthesis glycosyltransferase MftF [Cnuibacter physcomitrellae]ARJ05032.1 mycofactocin system glycosyltransferase [Cnuibacter physcomitrellae]
MRPPARLPDGMVVRLGDRVRVEDDGRALVGGAPLRVMYLKPAAVPLLRGRRLTVTDAQTAALADVLLGAGLADPVVSEGTPGPLSESEVTWVVPVRDRPEQLDRLLGALGEGATVIVVDDASRDPAAVRRVADAHGARLEVLAVNVGPAGARNHGLRLVTTPFVAFVDSDAVPEPGALDLLLRHFADPRVALVAPRILALPHPRPTAVERYEDARSSLDLGEQPALVRPRSWVSWVSSTCLVGRVELLGEGFGDGMRVAEDVDLAWRLDAEGHRVRYEPAAIVRHEHRATLVPWLARKAFYGTGAHPLAVRHPEEVAPAVLAPWSAAMLLALLAQRRWSVPVALAIAAVTVVRLSRRLPQSAHPLATASRLTADGVGAALVQAMALLLRHWWPGVAMAAVVSRRVRRAVAVAALVDSLIEWRRTRSSLGPVRFAVLRRLDDLAYGAGVWWSALRGRSTAALRPSFRSRPRG